MDLLRETVGPEHSRTTYAASPVIDALLMQRRADEAEGLARHWWWQCRRYRRSDHAEVFFATRFLAETLVAQGKNAEAEDLLLYREHLAVLSSSRTSALVGEVTQSNRAIRATKGAGVRGQTGTLPSRLLAPGRDPAYRHPGQAVVAILVAAGPVPLPGGGGAAANAGCSRWPAAPRGLMVMACGHLRHRSRAGSSVAPQTLNWATGALACPLGISAI